MKFENRHTTRVATSNSDDSLYLTRAGLSIDYNLDYLDKVIRISPFFEYQHNLDIDTWWRRESGIEMGVSFFNGNFYIGASFQHIWQRAENFPDEPLEQTTEWESRFIITSPIPWGIFKDRVKLRLFDEYTFDFTRGQGTFNEVGVTVDWQIYSWLRLPLGWRHIDRIHDFDSDWLEFSILFSF